MSSIASTGLNAIAYTAHFASAMTIIWGGAATIILTSDTFHSAYRGKDTILDAFFNLNCNPFMRYCEPAPQYLAEATRGGQLIFEGVVVFAIGAGAVLTSMALLTIANGARYLDHVYCR